MQIGADSQTQSITLTLNPNANSCFFEPEVSSHSAHIHTETRRHPTTYIHTYIHHDKPIAVVGVDNELKQKYL